MEGFAGGGELVGVLDCGPKRELEPYDPDERETLQVLVRAVGHTYDAIRTDALRSAVDRALTDLDLDGMSPREAMEALYRLKGLLS